MNGVDGEPACRNCGAVDKFSCHVDSALLEVIILNGKPEFTVSELGIDIELECCVCGARGSWQQVGMIVYDDGTPANMSARYVS